MNSKVTGYICNVEAAVDTPVKIMRMKALYRDEETGSKSVQTEVVATRSLT